MTLNFTSSPDPKFRHGEESDPIITPSTMTDGSRLRKVPVLPGETLADLAKRLFGANTELNRARILANNSNLNGDVYVPRV